MIELVGVLLDVQYPFSEELLRREPAEGFGEFDVIPLAFGEDGGRFEGVPQLRSPGQQCQETGTNCCNRSQAIRQDRPASHR